MVAIISKQRAASRRLIYFGAVALTVILGTGVINHSRGLWLSAYILYFFAAAIGVIMLLDYHGFSKYKNESLVVTINFFLS